MALGLRKDASVTEMIEAYAERINHPIKPLEVSTGPCKDNILNGSDVDLLKLFPTPQWHPEDGHRYIGTYHAIVVKDPDTGWVNWSLQRLGIHDATTTGMLISSNSHCGSIYAQ